MEVQFNALPAPFSASHRSRLLPKKEVSASNIQEAGWKPKIPPDCREAQQIFWSCQERTPDTSTSENNTAAQYV